jgi:hypothetical protein
MVFDRGVQYNRAARLGVQGYEVCCHCCTARFSENLRVLSTPNDIFPSGKFCTLGQKRGPPAQDTEKRENFGDWPKMSKCRKFRDWSKIPKNLIGRKFVKF